MLTEQRRPVSALAFSPDGGTLVAGDWSGQIGWWEVSAGTRLQEFTGHRGAITALVFTPQGTALVSASRDATVRYWEMTGASRVITQHKAAVGSVTILPGGRLLATGGSDSAVQFWGLTSGRQIHAMEVDGPVFGLGYSQNNKSLGVGTWTKKGPSVVHFSLPQL